MKAEYLAKLIDAGPRVEELEAAVAAGKRMKPTVDVLDLGCACGHVLRVHLEQNATGNLDISTRVEDACQSQTKVMARIAELEAAIAAAGNWAFRQGLGWQQRAEAAEARLERMLLAANEVLDNDALVEGYPSTVAALEDAVVACESHAGEATK